MSNFYDFDDDSVGGPETELELEIYGYEFLSIDHYDSIDLAGLEKDIELS